VKRKQTQKFRIAFSEFILLVDFYAYKFQLCSSGNTNPHKHYRIGAHFIDWNSVLFGSLLYSELLKLFGIGTHFYSVQVEKRNPS